MTIIERIRKLELPERQFVVIGSGVLDALSLRKADDIDLVVTLDYFVQLKSDSGWTATNKHGEEVLTKDDCEVWLSWGGDGTPNFQQLYDGGMTVDGIRFAHPAFVRDWKIAANRPKDVADIALLEGYLE